MREFIYAGLRLGLYDRIKIFLGEDKNRVIPFPLWKKLIAGSLSGSIGAAIATPVDLIKVRMQADSSSTTPVYKNTLHAFQEIINKEGFFGLFKGMFPTVSRAAFISAAMTPTYDHTKYLLLKYNWLDKDDYKAHICGALIAGFVMTVVSSPIDVVKTRIMNQQVGTYKNSWDCFVKV